MRLINKIVFIVIMVSMTTLAKGQGCSDAGFCTMNSLKPGQADSSSNFLNQIKVGLSVGKADHDILIVANYLEYHQAITEKFSMDAKLSSISQSGNGISVFGLSDILLSGNYALSTKTAFTLGVKIPLSNANKKHEGMTLPMDYQSSLGTFDLIAGFSYQIKKLQIVAAIQQPLTQNENKFIPWINPDYPEFTDFQSTFEFQRSGDVLVRLSYPFEIGKKIKLTPGILPIYHLSNDKATFILEQDTEEIEGSKGLTLNVNAFLDYQLSSKSAIQFNVGMPLITRNVRPDGLTRSFIGTLEYRFMF
ncbi:MAG: hypothetical protein K9H64_13695 [Bacteroidales bacterium]|nr:hypothetical protein [Bacteroidales bacterium]MCF8457067.1 hypothetical protein [Bacteroidales bacterium]